MQLYAKVTFVEPELAKWAPDGASRDEYMASHRQRGRALAQLRRFGCGGFRSNGYSGQKGRASIFAPIDAESMLSEQVAQILADWGATEIWSE